MMIAVSKAKESNLEVLPPTPGKGKTVNALEYLKTKL